MHIEKFGRTVLIDSDHPLALAQRASHANPASNAAHHSAVTTDTHSASAPAVLMTPESRPLRKRKATE